MRNGRMNIPKAVVTAGGQAQRMLALQSVMDRDGQEKTVLRVIIESIRRANIDEIAVVISPGDEAAYARGAGDRNVRFIEQQEARGYADALLTARSFVGDDAFLHLVGDHLYADGPGDGCARELVEQARREGCAVSGVQPTREALLPLYGCIGGARLTGQQRLYRIEKVMEKPTPTEAEQALAISGLRAGYYLCFFGMHVLTPNFMQLLAEQFAGNAACTVSSALDQLAQREQYLAYEQTGRRFDVGVKYGLFQAQLALALSGRDRDWVLAQLVENLAAQTTGTHASD